MNGRINVDMYNYFRRDYNLSSYKLDFVANQFISDNINDIKMDEVNNETITDETNNACDSHECTHLHMILGNARAHRRVFCLEFLGMFRKITVFTVTSGKLHAQREIWSWCSCFF